MWANHKSSAFTIVELLIVIVVIAVLAAITIVAYNGIQDRARASAAASSSSQASKKIKVWQVDNESTTPSCTQFYTLVTNTATGAPTGTCSFDYKDTNYQYTAGTAGAFCVTTTVVNKSYKVSESTTPQTGGCSGHGQGGVGAVTNVNTNPSFETNLNDWTDNGGRTRVRSTAWSHSGTASALITNETASASTINWRQSTFTPVTPGETITVSAQVRAYNTPSITSAARIYWYDSANAQLSSTGPTVVAVSDTSTTRVTASGVAPAGGASFRVWITGPSLPAAAGIYVDSIMIARSATDYLFADGNSSNWTWNGAANNSTSTGPPL